MKKHLRLISFVLCLGLLSSVLMFRQVQAQIDEFTYYIPFPANSLDSLFDLANNDNDFIDDNIVTTISISIRRSGMIIYYDHWEDRPETNLTSPRQVSSQVWGDDNPGNGIPPGFTTDILTAGDIITLRNTVELPRNRNQIFFDGGDKLTAFGGNLAVSLVTWPESAGTLYAGAWELLDASDWGREYILPIGVDLAGTGPGRRAGFGVVGVNVQAVEDNTLVELDLDADGTFEETVTLDQGRQFTQTGGDARSGAVIRASAPVQVHLFTGNPTPNVNYEARAYLLLPTNLWTGDYLAPRSSDGDFWLYNPHTTPLTVTAVASMTTATLTIPAKSTVQYPDGALSAAAGVRFTSTDGRPFSGVAALDRRDVQDWGYVVLPSEYLTSQVLVGWGPGNEDAAGNLICNPPDEGFESRVYVTALTTTTLTVVYDQNNREDVTLTPLIETAIVDPDDCDMTGAFLFTADGTPFVAVWGQDQTAPAKVPSIDVGTGQVPLASLSIQKKITLIDDVDESGTITWGDTVQFEIFTVNNTNLSLVPAVISDTLPATVDYRPGTSTVRGQGIADDAPPNTAFPFDEGGYVDAQGFGPQEVITATFEAGVKDAVDEIENIACVDSPAVPVGECATVTVPVQVPRLELSKRRLVPASGPAEAGDDVTFGVTITSTGNISLTRLPLADTYDENYLTFSEAQPFPPDIVAPGVITWTDLATATRFGPLPPGRSIDLTLTFMATEAASTITTTINTAIVEGAEGLDGGVLPRVTDEAEVNFIASPTPQPTLRPPTPDAPPPPEDDDDDDDNGGAVDPTAPPSRGQSSSPPKTPLPATATATPPADSTLPVNFLPETGSGLVPGVWSGLTLLLVLAFGLGLWFVRSGAGRKDKK